MSARLYWYFSAPDKRLRYGDGREIALGVTHTVDFNPVLCKSGLHASKRAIDALRYAPGPVVWWVKLGGTVVEGDDKACATSRTYVAGGVDVSDALCLFSRQCALDVIHLWKAPDVVVAYLQTGDEALRDAAWAAAWAAARDAAWAVARDAAGDAARAVARDAAWAVARDAAWAVARDAAGGAARAVARDAAGDAAGAAARAAQNKRLTKLLIEAIKAEATLRRGGR